MNSNSLSSGHCVPCEGGTAPFNSVECQIYSRQIPLWKLHDDEKKISRKLIFKNFKEVLNFTNRVGEIAEKEGHHPDLYIHDYKKLTITLSTHANLGLSKNDFILASKIDGLYDDFEKVHNED